MGLQTLFRDFQFYGIVDFLQRSIGIFMVPYYTRELSTADYGNLDLFIIISSTLLVLIDFQFIAALNRFFNEYMNVANEKRLVGTVVTFRLFVGIGIGLITFALGNLGLLEFDFSPSFLKYKYNWILVILLPVATSLYDGLIAHSRITRSKGNFSIISFTSIIISTFLAVFLVEYYTMGICGILLAMFLGKFSASILGCVLIGKKIEWCVDRNILRSIFSYSMPLVPSWWFAFLTTYFSRFFTYSALGPENSAVLAVTMKLLLVINFFALSFRSAWLPLAMSNIGDDNEDSFYINSNRILLISLFTISLILVLCIDVIVGIAFPAEYLLVGLIFPIFIVASIIAEVEINLQLGCHIAKKTIWISIGAFISFCVSVVILYLLTPKYNIYAIGLSLLFSSVVKLIVTYIASQKYRFIRFNHRSMLFFILGILAILVYSVVNNNNLLSNLLAKTALAVIGILTLAQMVEPREIQTLSNRLFRRKKLR